MRELHRFLDEHIEHLRENPGDDLMSRLVALKDDDQLIEAQIKEKQKATETFEAAKKAGKSASLLEQERPNVFSMKVANVMPTKVMSPARMAAERSRRRIRSTTTSLDVAPKPEGCG